VSLKTLPAQRSPQTREAQVTTARTALNVLVVDDHSANRLLMCQQLDFLGVIFH
jgi:two-component system sensor histidine kinase EvgS